MDRPTIGPDPNRTREGPFCVMADVPKRVLPGPFSYVESFSTGRSQLVRRRLPSRLLGADRAARRYSDRTAGKLAASRAFRRSLLPRR
jgi:hypothetical protein